MKKSQLKSIIRECILETLNEKANAGKLDFKRFPTPLSVVAKDPKRAAFLTSAGQKDNSADDDIIDVKKSSFAVSQLAPSQSTMNVGKAVGMAVGYMESGKAGGDLGAFISSDGRIMDGHHRWISSFMVDPNSKVGGYLVDWPAKQLIPVLNAISVGKFGKLKGKPGKGKFEDFNFENIYKVLDSLYKNGNEFVKAANVQSAVNKFSGGKKGGDAVKTAANIMANNIKTANFSIPNGAPQRVDMPIIDKEDVENAVKLLQGGYIDVNPPYSKMK
jgi:methylglyoxal synthase